MTTGNRRRFLHTLTAAACYGAPAAGPWDRVPGILKRIQPPRFPESDFDITECGAVGDGETDATDARLRADGGRVVVPPSKYLTGAIHLQSGPQPACGRERHGPVQYGAAPVPACGFSHAGRSRVHELFAPDLCLRAAEHRGHRRRHPRWPSRSGALVALEGQRPPRLEQGRPRQAAARNRLIQMVERDIPSPTVLSATAISSAPNSSSPTAAPRSRASPS